MRRQKERPAAPPPDAEAPIPDEEPAQRFLSGLRRLGPVVGWVAAVVAGAGIAGERDLLDVTLRGAAVWMGTWVLWLGGASLCERIVHSAPPPMTPQTAAETASGEMAPEEATAAPEPEEAVAA